MNQRRIEKYELHERLGRGAVGETWKAFDTQHHRDVAIKIIEVNPQTSSEFLAHFNREAQAVTTLHHPNIVQAQEFFVSQNGKEACIVMDYIEGQSLADYLDATAHTGNIPPPAEIVRLLMPIAAALDYAHQRGVLHGRLKPTVILLDKGSGTLSPSIPKLTTFGIFQKRDPRLLSLDDVSYIAPEIAQGQVGTSRSDLYSLGVIIYELCTGSLPFQGETASDILMQHIHNTPTSPALINPHIRPALTAAIMRSLAKDPAARFSSATALATAVAKVLTQGTPESTSQVDPSLTIISPPSSSAINDTMNRPTYLTPRPEHSPLQVSQASLVPPVVASSNTPSILPPTIVPSNTPILPEYFQAANPVVSPRNPIPTTAPSSHPVSSRNTRGRGFYIALVVVSLVALLGSALAAYLFYIHISPPATPIVGHTFFVSSGLISQSSNQGITDEVQINLQHLPDPQSGKRYYAWLMGERHIDVPSIALATLPTNSGQITLTYSDPQHNNLLANYSRFLITEEDANQQPINPSLDINTWRYYAEFSTTPNPADPKQFSLLNHLRHLLSQDPKLHTAGLPGGLDQWLFKNTTKILEAAGSARDTQKTCAKNPDAGCTDFMLRQVARILDYLDGSAYIQTENIPPQIQGGGHLLIDPTIARVALLEFDTLHQEPPGYLKHIGSHLQDITQISGSTADQRALAIHINQDINNVQGWLNSVHTDASKLIHMSSAQLLQPDALTTVNDLFTQANAAFVGQVDPNTNNVKEGVVQIHYNIQALATFDVAPCTVNNGQSSCV